MRSAILSRVLVSTSKRYTSVDQLSGHLVTFDLDNQKVVRVSEIIEPPYREENPNPRGGLRGLKGISIQGNRIALASVSTIFFYDEKWNPIDYIWHPSCAGIHDIALQGDRIWATSSRNDLLICLDMLGNLLEFFDTRTFAPLLNLPKWHPKNLLSKSQIQNGAVDFRDPRTHSEVLADSSHINSLAFMPNGDLLVSCGLLKDQSHLLLFSIKFWLDRKGAWSKIIELNKLLRQTFFRQVKNRHNADLVIQPAKGYSAILRISKDKEVRPCMIFDNATVPAHSVRVLHDGTAVYLKTSNGELVHFEPGSGKIISTTVIGEIFLRGARELPDGTLLLGDGNKIIRFDLQSRKSLSVNLISDNPSEAVFDFCLLPDHFDLPPESFVSHHAKYLPVSQV
jgi:WD40 repeat protein